MHTNVGKEKGEGEETPQTAAPSDPQRGMKRVREGERKEGREIADKLR